MSRDHSLLGFQMTDARKATVYTRRIRKCQQGGQGVAHRAPRVPKLASQESYV